VRGGKNKWGTAVKGRQNKDVLQAEVGGWGRAEFLRWSRVNRRDKQASTKPQHTPYLIKAKQGNYYGKRKTGR